MDSLSTTTMTNETWKEIIIYLIPPTMKWLLIIPSLYAKNSTTDIFSTLITHRMILNQGTQSKPTSGLSNTALVARTIDACTNLNCKAKKRSTHTTANCYWPGGGKEDQFPLNFEQRVRANVASSNHHVTEHFILSARVTDTLGNFGVVVDEDGLEEIPLVALISNSFWIFGKGKIPTFLDSGASDMALPYLSTSFISYLIYY